jgi:hypothetical protein
MKISRKNPFYNFKYNKKNAKDGVNWFTDTTDRLLSNEDKRQKNTNKKPDPANLSANNGNGGGKDSPPRALSDEGDSFTGLTPGMLFLAGYDAKWKDTPMLPVWDALPLFFVLSLESKFAIVLNIHYMPLGLRIQMLGILTEFAINTHSPDRTKLQLTWDMVKSISRLDPLRNCIKKHLYTHYTTRPMHIHADNYVRVASLPVEQWRYYKKGQA